MDCASCKKLNNPAGFTMIELVVVIAIIGILATVSTIKYMGYLDDAKFSATVTEMDALSQAIAGNPEEYNNGTRGDFGYVGDVGAMPPNLDALAVNPGYATWAGPYIAGDFESDEYKKDAWGVDYIYDDTLLRSIGSGGVIDHVIVSSKGILLDNTVSGTICDADNTPPGNIHKDSIIITLTYPDGAGGYASIGVYPDRGGSYNITSVPVGNHRLTAVHTSTSDTITAIISVNPSSNLNIPLVFATDMW